MWNKEVTAKYGVPKNTTSFEEGQNVKRQKLCGVSHESIDHAVFKWYLNIRNQNVPLSGAINQEKASVYAKEPNLTNIKASDGCLRRWKERRNITFKTFSGKSSSIIPKLVINWKQMSLPTLLSNNDLRDIFNADEFELFYKCMKNKTNLNRKSVQREI